MTYDDASGSFSSAAGATPDARDDLDALAAGDMGPATGNAISGSGTLTGASGADLLANPPGTVVAVEGAGGAASGAGEVLQAQGQYGVLTISGDGNYSYVRHASTPDGVQDVFTYTLADASGQRDTATLTIDIGRNVTGQTALQQLIPGADGAIVLPEGVQLSDITVSGRDLVIRLPDGSTMIIPDGAVFIPQLVLGDVEVPAANLAALLIGSEPKPAAGPLLSSGGNFAVAVGPLDPGVPLGDLLPPTALSYTPPTFQDLGQFIDQEPTIIIETPDNPAGVSNATATVHEAGLPARPGESPGSNSAADSEFTSGTIRYTAPDGFHSVTINGVPIAVGTVITTDKGVLTITGYVNGKEGSFSYTYQLLDNTSGDATADIFTITVTDSDGDTASATLTINIVDDVPTARNDSATQAVEDAPVTVNVFANDTPGADSVNLATGVAFVAGSLSGGGSVVYNGNGTFTYTPAPGEEGIVTFQYRITDGDGDVSTATVTITLLADSVPTITIAGGNSVNEAGLPARPGESEGSGEAAAPGPNGDPSETTSGTITVTTGNDTLASLMINGVNVTSGGTVTGAHGVLTVTLSGGIYSYSYTLGDNTNGDTTSDVFTIVATDSDGDVTSGNLTINIVDDVPTARDDVATQAVENAPVTVNVMTNDTPGADSVNLATGVALVGGSLTGSGNVVYNGDGTFTYNPGPGEEGTVTFQYRITDGDGDVSTATVTITLLADSTPTVQLSGGTSVNEAGLPARPGESPGSGEGADGDPNNNSDPSETTTGVITITTGGDTLASLVINGVNVTGGGTVNGAHGVLTVTLTGGVYSYSYTLGDNTNGDTTSDTFTVVVTDSDGDTASANLVIDIVDDVPTARNDSATQTAENVPITVNVIANDTPGADSVNLATGVALVGGSLTGTGTLVYNNDGTFTYTPSAGEQGTVTFQYQITDGDGDVSTATVTITLAADSVPIVSNATALVDDDGLAGGNPGGIGDDTGQGADETTFSGTLSANFGGDTPGTFTLAAMHGTSGTVGTETVNYSWNATTGVLTATGPRGVLFTVTLDSATGDFTVTLVDNVLHAPGGNENDATAAITFTATDSEGDSTNGTLTITFDDDTPTATSSGTVPTLTVDESNLAVNATASFAGVFAISFGADGPAGAGSLVYSLGINAGSTGLVDVASGHAIQLVLNGGVVEGRTVGSNHLVFTVSVDASGNVTLDQLRAVQHPDGSNPNDGVTLASANLITLSATATDGDGDSASATANIAQNLVFLDDGPTISASGTEPTLTVDESNLALDASASFAGAFTSAFGADGAGTISYALGINAGATGLVDTATGQAVVLVVNGGVVEGRTATSNQLVFTVSVNAAGTVTLDQVRAVQHANTSDPNDSVTLSADNLITLTATITDRDGDSASATINIGQNLTFLDDGPTAAISVTGFSISHDETPGLQGDANDVAGPLAVFAGVTNPGDDPDVSGTVIGYAQSSGAITAPGASFGADGAGSTTYSLAVSAAGVDSGLKTTDGSTIRLYVENGIVVGRVDGGPFNGQAAFAIAIDSATGQVSLVQYLSIQHPNTASHDESVSIANAAILAVVTVTDGDGDTGTASAAIGGLISFQDDGPTAIAPTAITSGLTNESGSTATRPLDSDGNVLNNFGADGPGLVTFANIANGQNSGLTSGDDPITYWLSSNGQTLEGRIDSTNGTDGTLIFRITLDQSAGTYTVDMFGSIDNGAGVSFSNLTSTSAGNVQYRGVGSNDPATPVDLLLSASSSTGAGATVNTDSDSIGVANQSMDPGESLRIDFVSNLTSGASTPTGFGYTDHVSTSSFIGLIPQVQGPQSNTVSFTVWALDTSLTQSGIPDRSPGDGFSDSSITAITEVTVKDYLSGNSTTLDISGVAVGTTVVVAYGISVTKNADGSVTFSGVQEGDSYGFSTGSGSFDAVVIQAVTGSFDLGVFAIGAIRTGDPVHLSYDLAITDGDGDSVLITDALEITVQPAGTTSSSSTMMVSQEEFDGSFSLLSSSNDQQKLSTTGNNTVLLGAVAAAGLGAMPAAASNGDGGQSSFAGIEFAGLHGSSVAKFAVETYDAEGQPQLHAAIEGSGVAMQGSGNLSTPGGQGNSSMPLDTSSQPAMTQLSQGTTPAQAQVVESVPVAAAVAMPSAEMLSQMSVAGSTHRSAEVERVLADALDGGAAGQSIEAALASLPGQANGGNAALQSVASPAGEAVPAWHNGAFGGFSNAFDAFNVDVATQHQDAAPQA
ncbi:MAG TPA: DUF5801 repeats-in-toxin domain-containing protein [Sphingomicrobium sp.]|nr:DUF5801 repeats-in-toxin domain-containing protein [Sphingomicrobium sp.]